MIRSPSRAVAWLLTLVLTASPALARPTPEQMAKAKAHFKQGQAFYDAGEFGKAVDEYLAAYELTPLPPLLFNIAQAYRKSDQWDKAVDYYKRYLEAAPDAGPSDEARRHVADLTRKLEAARAQKPPEPAASPDGGAPAKPVELDAATREMIRRQVLLEKAQVRAEEEHAKAEEKSKREQNERAGRDKAAVPLLGVGLALTAIAVALIATAGATAPATSNNSLPYATGIPGAFALVIGVPLLAIGGKFFSDKRKRVRR